MTCETETYHADNRLRGIARDMAHVVCEMDPYGVIEGIASSGYEATGDVNEDERTMAKVYLDTLTDPEYGVPYAIAIIRQEYLSYMDSDDPEYPAIIDILRRLEEINRETVNPNRKSRRAGPRRR